jgi:hypothetical protein
MIMINQFLDQVTEYLANNNLTRSPEIEARFKNVTYNNFTNLLNSLQTKEHTCKISKSVVSIRRVGNDTGLLMELNFPISGGKVQKSYKEKKILLPQVHDTSMILPFKLTMASEDPISELNMDNADLVRVKIRFSYEVPQFPNWVFDLTVMRQLDGASAESSLKTVVNSMLKPTVEPGTIVSVLDLENNNKIYKYEVEAEYRGDIRTEPLTRQDIVSVLSFIIDSVDSSFIGGSKFNQILIDIANVIGYKRPISRYTLKEILPQVELLSKDIYCKHYPPINMYVTDKADGLRSILFVKDGKINILSNKLEALDVEVSDDIFIICDGELVGDTIYIFDVLRLNDLDLVKEDYGSRSSYINQVVECLNNDHVKGKMIRSLSTDHQVAIDAALSPNDLYERDGLIFIEGGQSYSQTKSYKWKPLSHTTIDFLAKKYPYAVPNGIKLLPDHDLYYLFNGINGDNFLMLGLRTCDNYKKLFDMSNKSYFPIQFSPSTSPYAYIYQHPKDGPEIDGKVIELVLKNYDVTKLPYLPEWQLVRIREDRQADVDSERYFGNDFRIAEMTWNIFLDPLTLEELKEGCNKSYFMETKGTIYFAQVNVLSFVKEQRIEKYAGTEWVIDACCGRGADLGRFLRNKVKNLVCIDQDRTALSELIKRKYDYLKILRKNKRSEGKHSWSRSKGTSISVIVADFNDHKQVIQKTTSIIPKDGVNLITCNFALHYFLESQKSLTSFVMTCKALLSRGGQLVVTFMIGERIFEALKDVAYGESVDTYDHVIKNSIKKLYKEDSLLPAGQKIGVLLPFSQGEYYEEYLVNTEALTEAFESKGFTCSKVVSVNSSIPAFKHSRPNIYNLLTKDDHWYLDFFGEMIITRN